MVVVVVGWWEAAWPGAGAWPGEGEGAGVVVVERARASHRQCRCPVCAFTRGPTHPIIGLLPHRLQTALLVPRACIPRLHVATLPGPDRWRHALPPACCPRGCQPTVAVHATTCDGQGHFEWPFMLPPVDTPSAGLLGGVPSPALALATRGMGGSICTCLRWADGRCMLPACKCGHGAVGGHM